MMNIIRTLIVDDEAPARMEMKRFLAKETDFSLVGEAQDGEEAIRFIKSLQPHVVFLDINLPGLSGLGVARLFSELQSPPIVVFVTGYDRYAVEAFHTKALNYILKPFDDARFKEVCNRVRGTLENKPQAKEELKALRSYWERKPPTQN
jgi:YesN/AraC family two-component response regulator